MQTICNLDPTNSFLNSVERKAIFNTMQKKLEKEGCKNILFFSYNYFVHLFRVLLVEKKVRRIIKANQIHLFYDKDKQLTKP